MALACSLIILCAIGIYIGTGRIGVDENGRVLSSLALRHIRVFIIVCYHRMICSLIESCSKLRLHQPQSQNHHHRLPDNPQLNNLHHHYR